MCIVLSFLTSAKICTPGLPDPSDALAADEPSPAQGDRHLSLGTPGGPLGRSGMSQSCQSQLSARWDSPGIGDGLPPPPESSHFCLF